MISSAIWWKYAHIKFSKTMKTAVTHTCIIFPKWNKYSEGKTSSNVLGAQRVAERRRTG